MSQDLDDEEEGKFGTVAVFKPKFTVIRELYDSQYYTAEFLEEQLENALDSSVQHIIIEPISLGDETSKWIQVGNFLHKSAVLTGILSLAVPSIAPNRLTPYLTFSLTSVNLLATLLYDISWQHDPCCKYQVERNTRRIEKLQLQALTSNTPVVLVRRDDKYRKRLHNILACVVFSTFSWKLYKMFKN